MVVAIGLVYVCRVRDVAMVTVVTDLVQVWILTGTNLVHVCKVLVVVAVVVVVVAVVC